MTDPAIADIKARRTTEFPKGTRVRLVALAVSEGGHDDSGNLPAGTTGTVTGEPDSAGSLPIDWDNGSRLSAVAEDEIEKFFEEGHKDENQQRNITERLENASYEVQWVLQNRSELTDKDEELLGALENAEAMIGEAIELAEATALLLIDPNSNR